MFAFYVKYIRGAFHESNRPTKLSLRLSQSNFAENIELFNMGKGSGKSDFTTSYGCLRKGGKCMQGTDPTGEKSHSSDPARGEL
jgi:hypothetical protein